MIRTLHSPLTHSLVCAECHSTSGPGGAGAAQISFLPQGYYRLLEQTDNDLSYSTIIVVTSILKKNKVLYKQLTRYHKSLSSVRVSFSNQAAFQVRPEG